LIADPRRCEHGGVLLTIGLDETLIGELEIGASLAVAGVCLTVVGLAPGAATVELSPETLARTTLGELRRGSQVNLEPALRMGDPLGGHWVQGHVDATLEVTARRDLPRPPGGIEGGDVQDHREISFSLPPQLAPFLVEKGSVTIDGVSLTVARLAADSFTVALIPHTLEVTTLNSLAPGERVNVEVDVLAKYVRRALQTSGLLPDAES
jgi:riboflavin synthase